MLGGDCVGNQGFFVVQPAQPHTEGGPSADRNDTVPSMWPDWRTPLKESEMRNSNLQAIAARLSFPCNKSVN